MSSAEVKPKKLKKSKGAFGKDGSDPRAQTTELAAAAPPTPAAEEEAAPPAPKKEKKDKKRKAEEAATPAAESSSAVIDEEAAKKAKKERKAAKKAAAAAAASGTSNGLPTPAATPGPTVLSAESLAYLAEHKITVSAPYTPLLDMSALPIDPKLKPALKDFAKPTPIQACSWPALFAGKDVVGVAETGSGKTLGFGVSTWSGLVQVEARG